LFTAACGASHATPAGVSGTVTVAGKPITAADVLIAKGDKVIATTRATPRFSVPLSGDCRGMAVVVRLSDPIGAVRVPVPARCTGVLTVDVPAQPIVDLTMTVKSSFDWLDVQLTPILAGVPQVVILADGDNMTRSLWEQRITNPNLTVHVIAGTWRLVANREVDGPASAPPKNLTLDAVVSSGKPPTPKLGGFELEIPKNTKLELTLRPDNAR
jgi:hypothetical protein